MEGLRQVFKISVRGLEHGMFIARLDRPWLETNFPLQGFVVSNDDDIERLRHACNHVYVDIGMGKAPDPRYIELEDHTLVQEARARDEIAGLRKTDWTLQSDFTTELKSADAAHATLELGIAEVMEDLKGGRELDLQKLHEGVDAMVGSITRNPSAFVWLKEIKRKDNYTYQHALGCSVWAASFGRHLGLEHDELRELALAGLLFDVGKTRLPKDLLARTTSLDAHGRALARTHVEQGIEILHATPGLPPAIIDMVATHHERWDGSGYPHGLTGLDIPIGGRILGLIDSYDALTSLRPYADALSPHQAVTELYNGRGTLYQPELVEQFILTCGIFPTGSLVELTDGHVGVVTVVHSLKRLRPTIMLLLSPDKQPLAQFRTLDLTEVKTDAQGRPLSIRCGLPSGAYGLDPVELFLD